ncbi:hypothetical protein Ahy_A03g011294 [Arachis hypogaea]|uniref:CCHC-type domain-containing protein n=1 Tax=Arachis hypogaea TaxID=3818 RepID=A0A445DQA1_ARAHY|nr:hypothetical protein Ahy_A03g011294 [Arachis hypogaea]
MNNIEGKAIKLNKPGELGYKKECLNVVVHGIPHDFMDKETNILIDEILGVLVEVEDPKVDGVLRRLYLRIRVSINITKALPTGFWLDREKLPQLWVFFKYERLLDSYCFNCGILGHEKKTCKNPTVMACWDPTKKKYSPGLGVSQGRPGPTMGGGISKQQGWREEGEEQAREQLNPDRESGEEQSSKESRIRAERVLQQKIWKESEERDTQHDLGAAYKLSNLIKEIRERNNEWANNKKAQKGERRRLEVRLEKKKEKETIGQELKRLMLARTRDKQACEARTEGKKNQELLKGGTEENALRKLSKEAQNREHEFVSQHVKPGENVYYIELASDEDEDKGTEAQTDWETRLAKKLESKLNLKRKRENKQVPLLIYREWKEEQEDREPKKVKNSITTLGTGEYQLAKHVSGQNKGIQMVEEVDLNMPQPQP